jgi:hypothetical protein
MFKESFFFILLFCASLPAMAQSFRWDLEWYNSFQTKQQNPNNLIDPTGQRLDNPKTRFETDLRINTKYTWEKGLRFVFRPRFLGDLKQSPDTELKSDEIKTTTAGKVTLTEAYLEDDPTDTVTLSMGLENYQWGPAELIGPSNPFFHFHAGQRDYNYKEDGRFFLRMNFSPHPQWSLIAIAEPINNGDSFWIYEQQFKPKGAVKIERRGKNSFNYFGIDAGLIDDTIPFLGEYFNFEVLQGLSLYLDSRHSDGSAKYDPKISPDGLYDMVYVKNKHSWNTLLATGLRWEGPVDIRIEYIYNSFGLTKDLMMAAFQSAIPQHPRGDENLKKVMGSGREFLGQHYAYVSMRIPDLFVQNNNLAIRYLQSLMDQSASLQAAADTALGDAWTLFGEVSFGIGDNTQELSALEKVSGQLGAKWNF